MFTAIPKQTKNALFISLIFPEIFNNEKALGKYTYAVKTMHSKKISSGKIYLEKKVKFYSFLENLLPPFVLNKKTPSMELLTFSFLLDQCFSVNHLAAGMVWLVGKYGR